MTNCVGKLAATIVFAASMTSLATVAPAAPISHALAIKNAVPAMVETVQFRRWGWGVGAGLVAGAIVGGAIANSNPYYYGYGPYYSAPYPYYAPPPVVYGAPPPAYGPPVVGAPAAGDPVAYCMQRYRSYDPASGTFLGYDGLRHPCP